MSKKIIESSNEIYIEKAYILLEEKKIDEKQINLLINESKLNKYELGWRLFECIMKKAKNCKSSLYPKSLILLKHFFQLFPENCNSFQFTFKRMFANIILGLGKSGFVIKNKTELEEVINDFASLGFLCSKIDIFKIIFDKLLNTKKIISHYHFQKISEFLDIESDIQALLLSGIKEILVVGILAENYLSHPNFRFKETRNYKLLNDLIYEAKNVKEKHKPALEEKAMLYLKALLIAMGYNEKVIQFCFANYFYINAQIHYYENDKVFALICYDFASTFFKLIEIEYYKRSAKVFYYECLAYFYKKEKRFDDQEIALASYIKNLKNLIDYAGEKYNKSYYLGLLKFYRVKMKNALYKSRYKECMEIYNNFFKEHSESIFKSLNHYKGQFINDMELLFKAYKAEAYGRLLFEDSNYSLGLDSLQNALEFQKKRSGSFNLKETLKIEKFICYVEARQAESRGDNDYAYKMIKKVFQYYYRIEYIPIEYLIFYQIIKSKHLIEKGKLSIAFKILNKLIENEELLENFEKFYKIGVNLHELLKSYISFKKPMKKFEDLIDDTSETMDQVDLWNYKRFSLPIQQINCDFLKINTQDDYFTHLIKNFEKLIGIKIPCNNGEYYPIFERIILRSIAHDDYLKEFTKRYYEEGQKEPLIISYEGKLIDGNKRLAAIKLLKLKSIEKGKLKSENSYVVKIVRIPFELLKEELVELKSEINSQLTYQIRESFSLKHLRYLINLLNCGLEMNKICEIINIKPDKVSFYRSLYNLIEEFLIEINMDNDFYIIEKYGIFEHFEKLNDELIELGSNINITGDMLILMKERLKEIIFIWLKNNIDEALVSKNIILKTKDIKKVKFILIDPNRNKLIDKVLNKEVEDKSQIHLLLSGVVNKINIKEERRDCLDHIKLIDKRIGILNYKLSTTMLTLNEKEKATESLDKSMKKISKIISIIQNH